MTNSTLSRFAIFLLVFGSLGVQAQTVTTFEGIDASEEHAPEFDIDPNGAVGTKQYMEWTNPYYQAWDKTTFAPVWSAPQPGTTPFTVNGNSNCTDIKGMASSFSTASLHAGSLQLTTQVRPITTTALLSRTQTI
jgi:hypothetical protein